jgi:hypothetical protein
VSPKYYSSREIFNVALEQLPTLIMTKHTVANVGIYNLYLYEK